MTAPKTRVVIVDDHAVVRAGLRALLEREKDLTVVGEAGDAQHAVFAMRAEKPDVMLMDLKQPLKKGESVPIKLRFEAKDKTFKTIEIQAQVRELGASPKK